MDIAYQIAILAMIASVSLATAARAAARAAAADDLLPVPVDRGRLRRGPESRPDTGLDPSR